MNRVALFGCSKFLSRVKIVVKSFSLSTSISSDNITSIKVVYGIDHPVMHFSGIVSSLGTCEKKLFSYVDFVAARIPTKCEGGDFHLK